MESNFAEKKSLLIVNTKTIIDEDTGDKQIVIDSAKKIVAKVENVGMQTKQTGAIQNVNLTQTFIIAKRYYSNEKYCYTISDKQLFQINIQGKDTNPNNVKLNCSIESNQRIKEAIDKYLGGN